MLGYKVPSGLHDDSDVLSFASDHPRRRADRPPAQAAGRDRQGEPGVRLRQTGFAPGLQYFGAVVKKGEPLEPVRAALTEAVEDFDKHPPTPEEMERTRRSYQNASSAA
jgi:zinc protease